MPKIPGPLLGLWAAVVVPVVGVGTILYFQVQQVKPQVVYVNKPVAVVSPTNIPTATPSAAIKVQEKSVVVPKVTTTVTKTGGVK